MKYLDQYFGPWCMEPTRLRAAAAAASQIDWATHETRASSGGTGEGDYERDGDTAIVRIAGPMMKQESSLGGNTSTVRVRRALRSIARTDAIKSVLLVIDSPGGTYAGTSDLAKDIASLAKRKPVIAYVEDIAASAAYWVASQASRIIASETSEIGSIGTYAVVEDTSTAKTLAGVRVHVLSTGPYKGAGADGAPVTTEHLAEWQRVIEQLNEYFLAAVAKGRSLSLSEVRALADGRVHVAREAKALGLIDEVGTYDAALSAARREHSSRAKSMSDTNQTAATLDELRRAFPAASAEFYVACIADGVTLDAARERYYATRHAEDAATITALRAQLAEVQKSLDDATEALAALRARPGVPAVTEDTGGNDDTGSDVVAAWSFALAEAVKRTGSRAQAVSLIAREKPELRAAYVEAVNAARRRN